MKERISQWLEQRKEEIGMNNYKLEDIVEEKGVSNYIFPIKAREDLILRTNMPPSTDRIPHEAKVLKFLEKYNIPRVPRLIYYEKETPIGQPILIETSVGEEDISFSEMTEAHYESLASLLAEVFSIPIEDYNDFFNEDNPKKVDGAEFYEKLFKKHSLNPYREYMELCEQPDDRIKKFFRKQKKLIKKVKEKSPLLPMKFVQADLGNNFRHDGDEIYLIDWELATLSPVTPVVPSFTQNQVSWEKQKSFFTILKKYVDMVKFDEEMMEMQRKGILFNDMIWAARRLEQEKQDNGDVEKYRKLFNKRMRRLEKAYKS